MATYVLPCLSRYFKNHFSNESVISKNAAATLDKAPVKYEGITRPLIQGNPLTSAKDKLYNIRHAYVPNEYFHQIFDIDVIGQKLYEYYVEER